MPHPLRLARALTLTTIILVALAIYTAWRHEWIGLAITTDFAATTALAGRLERRAQRRMRAEATRAERLARPHHPEPPSLVPCCLLWVDSHGEVHDGRRCTRPLAARTHLNAAEQRAFREITDAFDAGRYSA